MKTINKIIALILIISMSSCEWFSSICESDEQPTSTIYLPVTGGDNNKFGFIDFNGELKTKNVNEIRLEQGEKLSLMKDGFAFYIENKTKNVVFVKEDGNGFEKTFTSYKNAFLFNEGLSLVVKDFGNLCYLDSDLKEVIQLSSSILSASSFYGGYAKVKNSDGLWGFIDKKGAIVVNCKYKRLYNFSGKNGAATFIRTENNKDIKGFIRQKTLKEDDDYTGLFDRIREFVGENTIYSKDGSITALNLDGSEKFIDGKFEDIVSFNNSMIYTKNGNLQRIDYSVNEQLFLNIEDVIIYNEYYLNENKLFSIDDNDALFEIQGNTLPLFSDYVFYKQGSWYKMMNFIGEDFEQHQGIKSRHISEIYFGIYGREQFYNNFKLYNSPINRDDCLESRNIDSFVEKVILGSVKNAVFKVNDSKKLVKQLFKDYNLPSSSEGEWKLKYNGSSWFNLKNLKSGINKNNAKSMTPLHYSAKFTFDKPIISDKATKGSKFGGQETFHTGNPIIKVKSTLQKVSINLSVKYDEDGTFLEIAKRLNANDNIMVEDGKKNVIEFYFKKFPKVKIIIY